MEKAVSLTGYARENEVPGTGFSDGAGNRQFNECAFHFARFGNPGVRMREIEKMDFRRLGVKSGPMVTICLKRTGGFPTMVEAKCGLQN